MAQVIEVRSPFDGSVVGSVPESTPEDVAAATATALATLKGSPLAQATRGDILERAADVLAQPEVTERLARIIAAEAAKPIKTARVEASRAVGTFTYAAAEARNLAGEMVPVEGTAVGEGKIAFTILAPVGVVGAISPFNFPLNLVAHKIAPAIAAGCPVVLKPASQTPLSAFALRDLLVEECGLPDNWIQITAGPGGSVGNALVDAPEVALISFTGSAEVGWGIRSRAPKKRVGLELGNNSPVVIEPDSDWERAVASISVAGFSHAGQSCISTQRVYVHRSIHDDFVGTLVDKVSALVVGDPMDDATDVSSLISTSERDRVATWIDEAQGQGAKVLCGGTVEGSLLMPTVIDGAQQDMRVCRDEVFGPVVAVQTYDDFEDALIKANDTRYGLQAAVFTKDIDKAIGAARTLDFGGVLINEVPTWRADQMPYGGIRESGNTREGPKYAVQEMVERRLVVIHS